MAATIDSAMALPTTPRTVLRVVTTARVEEVGGEAAADAVEEGIGEAGQAVAVGEEDAGEDDGEADLEDEQADALDLLQAPDQPVLDVGLEVGDVAVDVLGDESPSCR